MSERIDDDDLPESLPLFHSRITKEYPVTFGGIPVRLTGESHAPPMESVPRLEVPAFAEFRVRLADILAPDPDPSKP